MRIPRRAGGYGAQSPSASPFFGVARGTKGANEVLAAAGTVSLSPLSRTQPPLRPMQIDMAISAHGLSDQVSIIGFVDSAELAALYRGAAALVMPTYFGPTNLPPLEAWAVGTPVIYPEAFKAQAGDAAILFDYDDPRSLADAIVSLRADGTRERLRAAGHQRLAQFTEETKAGHRDFARHLERLKHRLALTPR